MASSRQRTLIARRIAPASLGRAGRTCERDPFVELELFRPALGGDTRLAQGRFRALPVEAGLVSQRRTELLAPVPERVAHELQERLLPEGRESGTRPRPQGDDRRLDAWRRPESSGRHAADDPRFGERLHKDREVAALASVARRRADTSCDLPPY